jgi:Flp pilus assembly protein CpaB
VELGDNWRRVGAGRRRALPAGRAVVGGFLVAVAAVIVFAASLAGASKPGQSWVVTARPLAAGTVLGPSDITAMTMRLSAATAALAFRQSALVEGRVLTVGLPAGELIQVPLLVPSRQQPALRPVSVAVDPVSLAGLVPGQPVDVLATAGSGGSSGGGAPPIAVVVRGATLIDVARSSANLLSPGAAGEVTLGVATLAEVEAIVQAAHSATITLVAAEPSDGAGAGAVAVPGAAGS